MNTLIREIHNCLKVSFNSIRFSMTLFLTTLIIDIVTMYMSKVINISGTILFISLIIDSVICIFTGITFILLGIQWIYCTFHNHYTGRKTYKNLVNYSIQIVLGNKYINSDLFKLHKNYPEPTLLTTNNITNYLVDRKIIKEVPDMLTPDSTEAYLLTEIGMDVCKRIFNNK